MTRVLYWTAAVVIGIASGALVSCAAVTVPTGSHGIRALEDPEVLARGRYLVRGPAHCAACHGDPARDDERRRGVDIPLSGGRAFPLGLLGTIVAPNITSDPVAGIGALSDATLVRSLRDGISRHGQPLAPFMSFASLADEDLQAILSFLRTLPPVGRRAPLNDLTWLGAFAIHVVLDPAAPTAAAPSRRTPARSADYGRYLAYTVANCHGCHTRRSRLTGAFVGPAFAGGLAMTERAGTFVPPNLRPGPAGIVNGLSERNFIARFRTEGRAQLGSPMPWEAFARMTDDDLGAIYRYLKTLPPGRDASASGPSRDRRRMHGALSRHATEDSVMAPLGFAEAGHGRGSAVRHSILMLRHADARHQDSRRGRGTREGSETLHRRAVSLFQHDQGARRGCSTRRSVTRLGDA